MTTGKRRKHPKNRHRHHGGWETYCKVDGRQETKWWPLTTPPEEMDAWVREQMAKRTGRAHKGTFAADVPVYLKAVAALPTIDERAGHMEFWVKEFGPRTRRSITRAEVQGVLQRLEVEDFAASTIRHYRTALSNFYEVMEDSYNPARKAKVPKAPDLPPRHLPYDLIERIITAMPDRGRAAKGQKREETGAQTKARLRVMMWTGIPQIQLARLQPSDLDLDAALVTLKPRRKGEGVEAKTVPLLPQAVEAFRAFDRLRCWCAPGQRFSTSSMWRSFQRACSKLEREAKEQGEQLDLSGLTPYQLRHSFATLMLRLTEGNFAAVQELLQHATPQQTLRYAKGAVKALAADAIATARQKLDTSARHSQNAASETAATPETTTS